MKYPKYRLAFPGKHVWVFNGHPMTQFNGYKLNTTAIGNGVVSADKSSVFRELSFFRKFVQIW